MSSQPGPNQIPYKVYKKCPGVVNYIFRIMFIAVRDKVIPLNWSVSDRIMISKVQNPRRSNIANYRQITLGNVEGKLFWSLIAQRFYQHLVTTGYRLEENPLVETSQSLLIFLTLLLTSIREMVSCREFIWRDFLILNCLLIITLHRTAHMLFIIETKKKYLKEVLDCL